MSVVESLIRKETDGTISFGNYLLDKKSKVSDFENAGDIYKVKIVPRDYQAGEKRDVRLRICSGDGGAHLKETGDGMEFAVEGAQDAQITVEMEAETVYEIEIDGESTGTMKTNLGGKLSLSVELEAGKSVSVKIAK